MCLQVTVKQIRNKVACFTCVLTAPAESCENWLTYLANYLVAATGLAEQTVISINIQ